MRIFNYAIRYLSVFSTASFNSCDKSDFVNKRSEQHSVVLNFLYTCAALNKSLEFINIKNQTSETIFSISTIPPGRSWTFTVNRIIRPSAVRPRSITRVRVEASMFPPQSTVQTLSTWLENDRDREIFTFFRAVQEEHLRLWQRLQRLHLLL